MGCGTDIRLDFINLDKYPHPGVNVLHDIAYPLPFTNQTFQEVHANHVLEHLTEIIPIMNEVWRILAPRGTFHISVPFWSGSWARGDPTHRRFFDHNSFEPFSSWHPRYKYLGIQGPWQKIAQDYSEDPDFDKLPFYKTAGYGRLLEMRVTLRKPD